MKILVEAMPRIPDKALEMWPNVSKDAKLNYIDKIIKVYNKPGLENIKMAIRENFMYFGIDQKKNPYMKFLDTLEFAPKEEYEDKFRLLTEYQKADRVDLSHDYLANESLYDRPIKEFEYTLNAFEIVLDKSRLSQYFDDITYIDASSFYDDNGNILPAGKEGDTGLDTIYGVIEDWSKKDSGESNLPKSTKPSFKYTLKDVFQQLNVPYVHQGEVAKKWVQTYWVRAKQIVSPNKNNMSYYAKEVANILDTDQLELSAKDMNRIQKDNSYRTIEDVPDSEYVEGVIVFVQGKSSKASKGRGRLLGEPDYYVYHDGDWITWDRYAKEVKRDKRTKLLTNKSISVINDKTEIVAGIIRSIDAIDDEDDTFDVNAYI